MGRTYKDLFLRFRNMQGYRQRFQNGYDGQGLWIEVEVEKEKGFKSKHEIETYGVDKFVTECKARVDHFSDIITRQSKRLGYFMQWDDSYHTKSDENNYTIWAFLKRCHDNGWLYKEKTLCRGAHDAVPVCRNTRSPLRATPKSCTPASSSDCRCLIVKARLCWSGPPLRGLWPPTSPRPSIPNMTTSKFATFSLAPPWERVRVRGDPTFFG